MSAAELHIHDDILELHAPELLQVEDVARIFASLEALRLRHPRPFLLVRNGGPTMSTAARKALLDAARTITVPLECATYGGGRIQRVVVDLSRRAVDLLAPGRLILASCKTREEAVAWIDARRRLPPPAL